jgi:geranylgeranyl reductase
MENGIFDVIVAGGGPAGATAAHDCAVRGLKTLLIDRKGRIKPCGGAIPTRLIRDFDIPPDIIKARIGAARIVAPSGHDVAMEIGDIGFVGMVDREDFDPFLRRRAVEAGAELIAATLKAVDEAADGSISVDVELKGGHSLTLRSSVLIGADGANSTVRRIVFGRHKAPRYVFAYHEIVATPANPAEGAFHPERCDVIYDGRVSPDFYGWVFPHGAQSSIGCGTAHKGHDLKAATRTLRERSGLAEARTIRREGAPLPLKPMRRWDNGRNVVLAGDAAGPLPAKASITRCLQAGFARKPLPKRSGAGIARHYARLAGASCANMAASSWSSA